MQQLGMQLRDKDLVIPRETIEMIFGAFEYENLCDLLQSNPLIQRLMETLQAEEQDDTPPFYLCGSVGMHNNGLVIGENRKEDVQAVMEKLYQIELLSTKDYYYENLNIQGDEHTVPVYKIPATIAAIEMFQKYNFGNYSGLVEITGDTRTFDRLAEVSSPSQLKALQNRYYKERQQKAWVI